MRADEACIIQLVTRGDMPLQLDSKGTPHGPHEAQERGISASALIPPGQGLPQGVFISLHLQVCTGARTAESARGHPRKACAKPRGRRGAAKAGLQQALNKSCAPGVEPSE